MATKHYTPEMGQEKPETMMEATLSYYGKHYFVDVKPEGPTLKGRGIVDISEDVHRNNPGGEKDGWKCYRMTVKAYEKLEREHDIAYESLLD